MIFSLLLFCWYQMPGGEQNRPPVNFFRNLSADQGLSHNRIASILQDRKGFIWFATADGLNRYDGYEFRVFKHKSQVGGSIADNQINAFHQDREGFLWLGTARGLSRFDTSTATAVNLNRNPLDSGSLSHDEVTALESGAEGEIWVGTRSGLNLLDSANLRFNPISDGPGKDAFIHALLRDRDGLLWVGAESGAFCYNASRDQWQEIRRAPDQDGPESAGEVRAIHQDHQGRVWIGGQNGLLRVETGSFSFSEVFASGDKRPWDEGVTAILSDAKGLVWIGTSSRGLIRLDPETKELWTLQSHPRDPSGLAGNEIKCLFLDRSGLLWVGTNANGASLLDLKSNKFAKLDFSAGKGPVPREVQAIYEDDARRLWVGTQTGLFMFDPVQDSVQVFLNDPSNPQSLSENQVLALAGDREGRVWVGTYSGGLNIFDQANGTFKRYQANPKRLGSLSENTAQALCLDRDGVMWVGTQRGLNRYRPENDDFQYFPLPDEGERTDRQLGILDTFQASDGALWLGTFGGGACRIGPAQSGFERFTTTSKRTANLSHDIVLSMAEDHNQNLWVGTLSGLNRFEPATGGFTTFAESAGLPGATIYSIIAGDHGELWLATNKGVARFDPGGQRPVTRRFDISDGLQSNDFYRGTSFRTSSGAIVLGGMGGLNWFVPDEIVYNESPPEVVLTSFKIFDRDATQADPAGLAEFELSYRQNLISFEFCALDFHAPAKNYYAFRLLGFEDEWTYSQDRRYASYSNLPGGNYVFQVKACNNDGFWNEKGTSLALHVQPPFWKTAWFKILLLAGLLGLFLLWHLRRMKHQQLLNRDLEELVSQQTRDLENTRQKLVEVAHHAGIFEIADGVLSQIGEWLGSIKQNVKSIIVTIKNSQVHLLEEAARHLAQELNRGLSEPEAQEIAGRLFEFEEKFSLERQEIQRAALDLRANVARMTDAIAVQHHYAKTPLFTEEINIRNLIEDALRLERSALESLGIETILGICEKFSAQIARVKLMHVISQVIRNSIEAMERISGKHRLEIQVTAPENGMFCITVRDTGEGLDSKGLELVFKPNYTTQGKRPGYGLHHAANGMHEMGGVIQISSAGLGQGTTVKLHVPCYQK